MAIKKKKTTTVQIYIEDLDYLKAKCSKGEFFRDKLKEVVDNYRVVKTNEKK